MNLQMQQVGWCFVCRGNECYYLNAKKSLTIDESGAGALTLSSLRGSALTSKIILC